MADLAPAPLTIAIGESVFALRARAPALVRPDKMVDNGAVLITRLVELTVVVGDEPLLLPPTRFAQIEQVAGVITGARLAPMAKYARLKPTDGLAKWLIKHAQDSGWELGEAKPVDLDALQDDLAKPRPKRRPVRKTYAVLHRGDATLHIVLEESATRGEDLVPRSPEPLFLVHTDIVDKPLRERQLTKLFARRKQMTGGTQSVPLSAWAGA